jgi:1-acyl-sn-glycerol-3-phosphate acyltransferase
MKKILFWPYQLYGWLILLPLSVIFTLVFAGLTVIASILVNPHFASRIFGVAWAKSVAFITPISVTVDGGANAQRGRSYVVVSNHQSLYDILVVYGWLALDLKWVMKEELRKMPGIGFGCKAAGHIFVDRKNPKRARLAIQEAIARLGDGIGILFFAEGTRSMDGRLLPFKTGAFRTAIEQQLPVLPVTVLGTKEVLPNKTLSLFPGRTRMVVHPCIETKDMNTKQISELMESTRTAIASALPQELG